MLLADVGDEVAPLGVDRRDPGMVQEKKEDDYGQNGADDHRVPNGRHGVPHERALIVDGLEHNATR